MSQYVKEKNYYKIEKYSIQIYLQQKYMNSI